jgi:hypothetical protein
MRRPILLALIGACITLAARAQSPPAVATVAIGTNGKSSLTIQNTKLVAITAVYWDVVSTGPERYHGESCFCDAATPSRSQLPISPGQKAIWPFSVSTMQLTAFAALPLFGILNAQLRAVADGRRGSQQKSGISS